VGFASSQSGVPPVVAAFGVLGLGGTGTHDAILVAQRPNTYRLNRSSLDVQTIGNVPATQTAGVLEVGVCKERTYRRLVSPSSRLIRSKLEEHTQHASIGLACDE
jgi:hypothetical protein